MLFATVRHAVQGKNSGERTCPRVLRRLASHGLAFKKKKKRIFGEGAEICMRGACGLPERRDALPRVSKTSQETAVRSRIVALQVKLLAVSICVVNR